MPPGMAPDSTARLVAHGRFLAETSEKARASGRGQQRADHCEQTLIVVEMVVGQEPV